MCVKCVIALVQLPAEILAVYGVQVHIHWQCVETCAENDM